MGNELDTRTREVGLSTVLRSVKASEIIKRVCKRTEGEASGIIEVEKCIQVC